MPSVSGSGRCGPREGLVPNRLHAFAEGVRKFGDRLFELPGLSTLFRIFSYRILHAPRPLVRPARRII